MFCPRKRLFISIFPTIFVGKRSWICLCAMALNCSNSHSFAFRWLGLVLSWFKNMSHLSFHANLFDGSKQTLSASVESVQTAWNGLKFRCSMFCVLGHGWVNKSLIYTSHFLSSGLNCCSFNSRRADLLENFSRWTHSQTRSRCTHSRPVFAARQVLLRLLWRARRRFICANAKKQLSGSEPVKVSSF